MKFSLTDRRRAYTLLVLLLLCGALHGHAQWPKTASELAVMPQQLMVDAVPLLATPYEDFVVYSHVEAMYLASNVHRQRSGMVKEPKGEIHPYELTRVKRPALVDSSTAKLSLRRIRAAFGDDKLEIGGAFSQSGDLLFVTELRPSSALEMDNSVTKMVANIVGAFGSDHLELRLLSSLINECNMDCSNFHPTLDPLEQVIVFSSNRLGSFSVDSAKQNTGADLYYACRRGSGWQGPWLLPVWINGLGNEITPAFGPNGMLFFASDRAGGLGGYDLYMTQVRFDSLQKGGVPTFGPLWHLPEGFNSGKDDLGLAWRLGDADTNRVAYFSSNRSGNDLDIFRMQVGFVTIQGRLVSAADNLPVAGVPVTISAPEGKDPQIVTTDDAGRFVYRVKSAAAKGWELRSDAFAEVRIAPPQLPYCRQALGLDLGTIRVQVRGTGKPVTVMGEVHDELGRPFVGKVALRIYRRDSGSASASVPMDGHRYLTTTSGASDFYLDVMADGYAPRTIHYHREELEAGETLREVIQLERGKARMYTMTAVDAMTQQRLGFPVARLIRFEGDTRISETVAVDVGDSLGLFRIAIPDSHANCSLIVSPEGYLPLVLDLSRDTVPSMLACVPVATLYKESLKVFHPYKEPSPEILSRRELEQISQFLLENPAARIQVASHTDCKGGDDYNLLLSRQRAASVADYIVRRTNIDGARIAQKGFGETQLHHKHCNCQGSVDCTKEEHGINRRTEITLLSE